MRRVHCTNHCAVCAAHFHSEEAFAAHRAGGVCMEPADDPRFASLSDDGACRLGRYPYTPLGGDHSKHQVYPPGWKPGDPAVQRKREPVTIWTLAASLDRARRGWVRQWRPPAVSARVEGTESQTARIGPEARSNPSESSETTGTLGDAAA